MVRDDEVRKYLQGRRLIVPLHGVRTHKSMPYYDDGKLVHHYAAMCCSFVSPTGKPLTYHVTYVSDGQKAPVEPCRKVLPPVEKMDGGAIRLSPVAEHIGIAEGVETAIAAGMLFDLPTWAATNADMLSKFRPPEGVKAVTVFGDNDANYTGQAAAYALARRLSTEGYGVRVFIPSITGTDWCDMLPPVGND
jgi:putative DNA primase/helicase